MKFRTENIQTGQQELSRLVAEITPGETAFAGECSASMLNQVSGAARENGKEMHMSNLKIRIIGNS